MGFVKDNGLSIIHLLLLFITNHVCATTAETKVDFIFGEEIPQDVANNGRLTLDNYLSRYPVPVSEDQIKSLQKNIPNLMRQAAEPFGYFDCVCKSSIAKKESWQVTIHCKMPNVSTISDISIQVQGPGKAAIEADLAKNPTAIQPNSIFSALKYEQAKQSLLVLAYKKGFMDANTDGSKIIIKPEKHHAQLFFKLNTGYAYSFGPISFSNMSYNSDYLRAMAPFKQDDHYTQEQLFLYQQELMGSNLFESVSIKPRFTAHNESKYVPVYVEYKPIYKFQRRGAISYNTDTQVNLMLGLRRNRIGDRGQYSTHELSKENVFGKYGTLRLSNTFIIPNTHPTKDYSYIDLTYADQRINYAINSVSEEKSINLIVGQSNITSFTDDRYSFMRNYGLNLFSAWNTPIVNNISGVREYNAWLYPSIKQNYYYFDRPSNRKYNLSLDSAFNHRFLKVTLSQNLFLPFSQSNRLLFNNTMGFITTKNYLDLPKSWSFLTGGNTSVRGFAYDSIGASSDDSNFNKVLFENSIEHQLRLYQNFFLIEYYDVGKASKRILTDDYYQSIGSGVIWESPFGIIELSIAKRLNELTTSRPSKSAPCNSCRYILAFKNKIH